MDTQSNTPGKAQPSPKTPTSNATLVTAWILVCLGFVLILWKQDQKHVEATKQWGQTASSYSNQVISLDEKLAQQSVVNATLETNLAMTKVKASNDLAAIEATLSSTSSSLEKAQAEAKAAEAAAAEKDKKIAELVDQNTELDKQSGDLRDSITNLETQIQETQKKLDRDEGDKQLLMTELARLQAQKDDLEKKLNDLAFLKEQVRSLREELSVARRLDWIRRGIYEAFGTKGGERLIHPLVASAPPPSSTLEVELQQNGGVKVNSSTNGAPGK